MTAAWAIDLPMSEKLVLLALADNANDEGVCWPSVTSLVKKCSAAERTVRGAISSLAKAGHLTVHERAGRSNYYTVHPLQEMHPCKSCTPAGSAPTPAPDAPPPLQLLHPTPAAAAPIIIIEPSVEPPRNHQRARKRTSVPRDVDPEWVLDFKLAYPERAGAQGWSKAVRAANARMVEGHTTAEFIAGARRYATFCEATGKTGSEYVKQACTFLGPDKPFLLPWHPPPKPETASERILRSLNGTDERRVIEHDPERIPRAITR